MKKEWLLLFNLKNHLESLTNFFQFCLTESRYETKHAHDNSLISMSECCISLDSI